MKNKNFLVLLLLIVGGVIAVETFSRFYLGLGTPPLYVTDPKIEYQMAPNQDVNRFGNRQLINELGMRSAPVASWGARKRVLVLGDSVVNGGNLTDHKDLATSLLTSDQVVFANISAGSWGPENQLAWIEKYGLLGAKEVILVISSHDLADFPSFDPLDPNTHPIKAPLLAIQEGVMRYLPRYLPSLDNKVEQSPASEVQNIALEPEQIERALKDLKSLTSAIRASGAELCAVQHLTQSEIAGQPEPSHELLLGIFNELNVPVYDLGNTQAWRAGGSALYRDDIHLGDLGQIQLSRALKWCDQALSSNVEL
jgi:hypothetical protein